MEIQFWLFVLISCFCLETSMGNLQSEEVPLSYIGQLEKISKVATMRPMHKPSFQNNWQAHSHEIADVLDFNKWFSKAKYLFDNPKGDENILLQLRGLTNTENGTSTCIDDIGRLIEGLFSRELWPRSFFDAAGKPGPSLLLDWLSLTGNYDQCRAANAPASSNVTKDGFTGNYCPIALKFPKSPLPITFGACLPSTCSPKEISELVGDILTRMNVSQLNQVVPSTTCLKGETEVTAATVCAILILVVTGVLALLGTFYDVFFHHQFHRVVYLPTKVEVNVTNSDDQQAGRKESSNGNYGSLPANGDETTPLLANGMLEKEQVQRETGICGKILLAFSLYSNGKKLLDTSTTRGTLGAVHGIRFLSMTWVVLGHVFAFGLFKTMNWIPAVQDYTQRVSFDVVINALVSVDTFFTLSGLLTAYLTIKELKRKSLKINWGMFYFHRFWRLTPPYMFVLVIVLGLQQYCGSGPFWGNDQPMEKKNCENNWWTNLLYVNNIVKTDEPCFVHSWYLANDMQFFLISPLMMVPFYFHWAAGVASCAGFLLISWITTGVLSYQNNWPATFLLGMADVKGRWFQNYYFAPWCRIGPYVVGILAGYFLTRTIGKQFKMHWFVALSGWIVATASALAVLFGVHGEISGHHVLTTEVAALYNAVSRSVWGACVCWVVIACSTGYGGPVNAFLSWSPFVVLGRLTYMTYLVHLSIVTIFFDNMGMPYYLNDFMIAVLYVGLLVVANLAAFVFVLLLESPMIGLEKALWRK